MARTKEIKEALRDLQKLEGVEHCWIEEEAREIFHVYTVTRSTDYAIQKRVFQKYSDIEVRFPEVSFEFRTTSLSHPPAAEMVF